jgi:hypothetical protein
LTSTVRQPRPGVASTASGLFSSETGGKAYWPSMGEMYWPVA